MGIPLFFKIISEKYDNTTIYTDSLKKGEFLFLDMNCLIHPCCKSLLDDNYSNIKKDQYEKKMLFEIENYLKKLIVITKPEFVYLAIDGVAPCSKMNQQRLRRFKTVLEREEHNKIKKKLNLKINNDYWDSNCISPGTPFMIKLQKYIKHLILNTEMFENIEVIFSDSLIPGEGEHKILSYIRNHDFDNKNIIIYGLDADLIMLAMSCNKNNVYLLREELEQGTPTENFIYFDIDNLKCNIMEDFKERYFVGSNSNVLLNDTLLFNVIHDYIFICFFLGNDFLPHILGLDLRYQGLDIILNSYVKAFSFLKENIVQYDKINTNFLKHFLYELNTKEESFVQTIFKKRLSLNKFFKINETEEYERHIALLNNYPVINMNEEKYIIKDNFYIKDWKKRYYLTVFNTTDEDDIDKICKNYVEGIVWTNRYYMHENDSWHWKYNYLHAPLLSDIYKYIINLEDINKIKFPKDAPVHPHVQLLSILPINSKDLLPKECHFLFTKSNISYLYPIKYDIDILFNRYYWMCAPKLPYLDIKKVIREYKKVKNIIPYKPLLIRKAK